jgi:soluble lytic murein transglycosylase
MAASAQDLVLLETFPADRWRRACRSRGLGWGVLLAIGAAAAGSVLGLVASPGPRHDETAANLAWTSAAAVQTAQRSEERARAAEQSLSEMRARLDQLEAAGAVQELRDWMEAKRLGLDRALGDRGRLWGDDRRRVLAAIVREARRNGLDPVMVAAVIEIESHFDPFAVSEAGAYGLMQLMPPTAQELFAGRNGPLKTSYLFNPVLNIELGTAYMAQLLRRFDGDAQRALIAYNAGPSVARALVRGSKSHRRLQSYPRAVLAAYRNLLLAQQESGARLAQR